ncbi:MAG: hypothetical protein KKA07_07505 [Bacteroidetes bacterium]|nr:hypothetical protein [Bacteroidota bacterium]MBU1718907.1 hypothetical protein [Bacteroidota bacterium]
MPNHRFYFVVCGAAEHIRTLNFAIRALQKVSKVPIRVVTDSTRNEIPVEGAQVLDIRTPDTFDHHQASIFLKTSLPELIEDQEIGCYLDSDVIALSPEVDTIFSHFAAPVTFAKDHSPLKYFSPYALNCDCLNDYKTKVGALEAIIKKHNPLHEQCNIESNMNTRELFRVFDRLKRKPFRLLKFMFPFYFGSGSCEIKLEQNYSYRKKTKLFYRNEEPVLNHALNFHREVKAECGCRYTFPGMKWKDVNGSDVYSLQCDHLAKGIAEKFGVQGIDNNWQHWNGGVFLFNKASVPFMKEWNERTLAAFDDPYWRTRDQGTLVATVWNNQLQNHILLDTKYNFIADFYNPLITWDVERGFTTDNFKTMLCPVFIHVYHHFGDINWEIWQGVEQITHLKTTFD